jgi:predicted small metal-binding protein
LKELRCRDAGFDCDAVVHGEAEGDVMAKVEPPARDAHGVDATPQVREHLVGLIRDV